MDNNQQTCDNNLTHGHPERPPSTPRTLAAAHMLADMCSPATPTPSTIQAHQLSSIAIQVSQGVPSHLSAAHSVGRAQRLRQPVNRGICYPAGYAGPKVFDSRQTQFDTPELARTMDIYRGQRLLAVRPVPRTSQVHHFECTHENTVSITLEEIPVRFATTPLPPKELSSVMESPSFDLAMIARVSLTIAPYHCAVLAGIPDVHVQAVVDYMVARCAKLILYDMIQPDVKTRKCEVVRGGDTCPESDYLVIGSACTSQSVTLLSTTQAKVIYSLKALPLYRHQLYKEIVDQTIGLVAYSSVKNPAESSNCFGVCDACEYVRAAVFSDILMPKHVYLWWTSQHPIGRCKERLVRAIWIKPAFVPDAVLQEGVSAYLLEPGKLAPWSVVHENGMVYALSLVSGRPVIIQWTGRQERTVLLSARVPRLADYWLVLPYGVKGQGASGLINTLATLQPFTSAYMQQRRKRTVEAMSALDRTTRFMVVPFPPVPAPYLVAFKGISGALNMGADLPEPPGIEYQAPPVVRRRVENFGLQKGRD